MITYEFKNSFDKSVKSISERDKRGIKELCKSFIDVLEKKDVASKGLGSKRLKESFWEVRGSLRLRILFRWEGSKVEFILAGNHDQIKRFLKEKNK